MLELFIGFIVVVYIGYKILCAQSMADSAANIYEDKRQSDISRRGKV